MKKVLLTLALLLPLSAVAQSPRPVTASGFREYTFAALPTSGRYAGLTVVVTDAASAGDCTAGSGSSRALCRWTGSAWESIGGAGGSGNDFSGASDADLLIRASASTVSGLTPGADGTYPSASSSAWVVTTPGLSARTDADGTAALLSTDRAAQVNVSHASANAVSIAQAGTTGFEAGYVAYLCQTGAGATTLTATTSTFNITGTTSFVFSRQYSCARIRSDGTNYEVAFITPIAPIPITFGFILGADNGSALTTADDQATIFVNRTGRSLTITEVWIECDATDASTSFNIQNDDGSAANILSSDVTCNTTGQTGTLSATEKVIANGSRIDLLTVTASAAKRMTLWVSMQ